MELRLFAGLRLDIEVLSCQSGVWKKLGNTGGATKIAGVWTASYGGAPVQMISTAQGFCYTNYVGMVSLNSYDTYYGNVYVSGANWYVSMAGSAYPRGQTMQATCIYW